MFNSELINAIANSVVLGVTIGFALSVFVTNPIIRIVDDAAVDIYLVQRNAEELTAAIVKWREDGWPEEWIIDAIDSRLE
jgi:hypothetical protein